MKGEKKKFGGWSKCGGKDAVGGAGNAVKLDAGKKNLKKNCKPLKRKQAFSRNNKGVWGKGNRAARLYESPAYS